MPVMDVLDLNLGNPSLPQAILPQPHPYSSALASSASSSSSSVFSSDCISSQSSISSTTSVDVIWENEVSGASQAAGRVLSTSSEQDSNCFRIGRGCGAKVADAPVALELRQNPRRTAHVVRSNSASSSSTCTRLPPSLVRQSDRKLNFVDNLVDSAAQIVEAIWPLSVVANRSDATLGCKGVLPLRTFIQETLRRSRTSYSTLQVALYYLILIKPHVPKHDFTMEQPRDWPCSRSMQCGRRMFLAALILASKYLQDRNYSARAWSKISGLNTAEINQNEMAVLEAVQWKLHISEPVYLRWADIVLKYTSPPGGAPNGEGLCWQNIIPVLTPALDTVELGFGHQRSSPGSEYTVMSSSPSPCGSPLSDISSGAVVSNDPTPTYPRSIPSTLEPNPRIDYALVNLPSLPKLGLLPTPMITPSSSAASTPAVGVRGISSRRPSSICAAMSQARNLCAQRTTLDQRPPFGYNKSMPFEAYPTLARRSSLARSASSTSSPESMVSDVPSLTSSKSSRSSRSSSISSVTSGTCAPTQFRLAMRATRRGVNLQPNCLKKNRKNLVIATPIDEGPNFDFCASPEPYSATSSDVPDMSDFSIGLDDIAREAAQGLCELSGAMPRSQPPPRAPSSSRRCRKRGRTSSSDEHGLQKSVRQLMSHDTRMNEDDSSAVAPDSQVADSFLITQPKAAQSSSGCSRGTVKLPVPLSLPRNAGSMKRACCGEEAAQYMWGARNALEDMVNLLD
ncbi:hypothetical protein AJ80_09945 [Polytolypa hystricis UAMH7299]|uniref:Cyclin N-terminal domain-containing protein n=1 Tax=Polytolypa hystricis (strain UAMH7299) TaxID=1447883 RepID=A0A2B7WFU0_POLH7|nr:hypothetical protein AJ80_09945 [Polytolypa hystricis UAMH7299]